MADSIDRGSETSTVATIAQPEKAPTRAPEASSGGRGESKEEPEGSKREERSKPANPWIKRIVLVGLLIGLVVAGFAVAPRIRTALDTVSTDDAYINGHFTLLAARVGGQVAKVLVDDNMRVRRETSWSGSIGNRTKSSSRSARRASRRPRRTWSRRGRPRKAKSPRFIPIDISSITPWRR